MSIFLYKWEVKHGDRVLISTNMESSECRELAAEDLSRAFKCYMKKVGCVSADNGDYKLYNLLSAISNHVTIKCETYTLPKHTIGEDNNLWSDHIISKLRNKFPNIVFESSTYPGAFRRNYCGIIMEGDYSIVHAFYWAQLLLRLSSIENSEWESAQSLMRKHKYDESSIIWHSLRKGIYKPDHLMAVATGYGPVDLYDKSEHWRDDFIRKVDIWKPRMEKIINLVKKDLGVA